LCPYISQSPLAAALSSMSFVTTACGGAPGRGSAAPPDPCPHSGAATSAATATVANHRVQCIIPTSVKGRRLFSRTQRESHIHVPARSRLIIASIRRVDNHRRDLEFSAELHPAVAGPPGVLVEDAAIRVGRDRELDELVAHLGVEQSH